MSDDDHMNSQDVATGITNFTGRRQWLGVLWILAILAADPEAMKKPTEASPEHLDFLKYDAEHGPFISDCEACEKYFKEHGKEIWDKYGMNMKNCCPLAPDKEGGDG